MEKIIRVGNIEVKERSCMVEFNLFCEYGSMNAMEITHNALYQLLDSASSVKLDGNKIVFVQGIVTFEAYKKTK